MSWVRGQELFYETSESEDETAQKYKKTDESTSPAGTSSSTIRAVENITASPQLIEHEIVYSSPAKKLKTTDESTAPGTSSSASVSDVENIPLTNISTISAGTSSSAVRAVENIPLTNASTAPAGSSYSAVDDIENIPPNPQLIDPKNKLSACSKDISKAFPWTKFRSDRDEECFQRVKGHLGIFKRECFEQSKNFVDSKQWKNAIDYIIIAWQYVDQLPRWDDLKHNKLNEQCYKKLTSHLISSLKKGTFQKEELQDYIVRFKKLAKGSKAASESDNDSDNRMQKSITLAEAILKKIK